MGKIKSLAEVATVVDSDATAFDAVIRAAGVTNQTQWNAFIDLRTDAQILAMVRKFFKDSFKQLAG